MPSGRGIVIEIIGDDRSYLRAAESAMAANTKLDASFKQVAVNAKLSADAQIAAAVKAQNAMRANVAALGTSAAKLPAGSQEQTAALALQAEAQAKLNRSLGLSAVGAQRFGSGAKTAERDLNKFTRGVLSGSGILSRFGRSLAFASSGFIAAALGAAGLAESIKNAEDLAKAQESLSVAIRHTGGDLQILLPRYEATAKAAAKFGITQVEATTGLARATVLTGDAAAAQRAYQEALVISKATGKDFNVVLTAAAKGQEGITTSLRRYGVLVDSTSTGQEQFNLVMKRFGGQAAANTTATEKLHAAFVNALTTIGTALLPSFEKLTNSLADWLTKMNESGKLEKDVATGMKGIHDVADPLIGTIHDLASAFGDLNKASKGFDSIANKLGLGGLGGPSAGDIIKSGFQNITPLHAVTSFVQSFSSHTPPPAPLIPPSTFFPKFLPSKPPSSIFGTAQPLKQFFQKFQLNFAEQLAQVQASLTRSSKDDVAAARRVVGRIKKLIDEGRLHGNALVQALGLEASALNTIWSAEDAAAQKRAQRAQAAKARIQAQLENQIDPLRLEVALSRAQALGKPFVSILRAMRASAQAAIASGKLTLAQQKEAWDRIAELNQQIKDALTGQTVQFQVPAKLALRLARDTALGRDTTKDLLSIKKAILKFISTHKKNIAALTDAYNQLAAINQQLGSSAQSALGLFKQASTKALTEGLGLTDAQRKALRARLSQLGPGGTVPGQGVGAAGFVIGPDGRPIRSKGRGPTISGRDSQTVSPSRFNHLLRILERTADRPLRVIVDLDGKIIADNTTRHQERSRRHNSSQRRGPLAGAR
jgi:hypothetical protein